MAHALSDETKPPLKGWLEKAKNDSAASRLLKKSNRRYFTLDFESHTFYYAHTEGGKVSFPTPFTAILEVEAINGEQAPNGTLGEDNAVSAQEVGDSSIRRSSSFTSLCMSKVSSLTRSAKHRTGKFGFCVRLSGKSFELYSNTKEDADKWIQGFQSAIEMGRSGLASKRLDFEDLMPSELVSTSGGSSNGTTSRASSKASVGHSQDDQKKLQDEDVQDARPSPVAAFESNFLLDAHEAFEPVCGLRQEASQVNSQESFFPSVTMTMAKGYASPRSCDGTSTMPLALAAPRSARSTASGDKRSPRQALVTSLSSLNAIQGANDTQSCWGRPVNEVEINKKYSDKDRGLSIRERLAQMEFSDDENSDEDVTSSPRPNKDVKLRSGYANMLSPVKRTDSIVVEACETFVAPADDSDTD